MRLPRWLFMLLAIVGMLYWSQSLWTNDNEQGIFDLPKTLEKNTYTIIVYPVSNINGVPVFTTGIGGQENDYLYVIPASGSASFPADYTSKKDSGYVLQLTGRFYKGKGIPQQYLYTKPKPERLRIFRFENAGLMLSGRKL